MRVRDVVQRLDDAAIAARCRASKVLARIAALAMVTTTLVVIPLATPAVAMTCNSSGQAGYSVSLCVDDPLDGATISGPTSVAASATITGPNPGINRMAFYLGGSLILTDFEAPFQFVLPSDTFVDGTTTLEVETVMRDNFVTARTTISVTLSNGVATPPPPPTGFTPTQGTTPGPGEPFVLAATGDGAGGETQADDVLARIGAFDPNLLIYLGDVYDDGTYTEFYNWYGITDRWGAFKSITNPVLGNHEQTGGQWPGYDFYWATPPPYYSYDANGWHFIVLEFKNGPSAAQTAWLTNDLANNQAACTIAAFHHPVLSVGPQGDEPDLYPTWELLVDNGVDVVMTGHDHSYQRWVPLDRNLAADPAGMTQFVLGAGGHGVQGFVRTDPRLAAGADTTPTALGALRMELNQDGASFGYENTAAALLDSGTIQCSGTPTDTTAPSLPTILTGVPASGTEVDLTWSPATDNVGIDGYAVYRDGGLIGTVPGPLQSYHDDTASPNTTYVYTVEAFDGAGNPSGQSAGFPVTTPPASPALSFNPVADSYVDGGSSGTNYGTSSTMRVDGSPDRRSYVRFDVTGLTGTPTSATLRVYANSTHSSGYEAQQTSNGWGELSITHANALAYGPLLGGSGPFSGGNWTEVDVTGYVTGNGSVSFALTPLSNTNMSLATRESSNPPELVIVQDTTGNNPPVADDLTIVTDEDVSAGWTPSVSDPDPGAVLTCAIDTQPANGVATVASDCSTGTYIPNQDFNGTDPFVYRVSDGGLANTGQVSVTVNPINDAPSAGNQSVVVIQSNSVTITLTSTDVDGDCPLVYATTSPSNGSLGAIGSAQCSAGVSSAEVEYTPTPGYTGPDSFTFQTTDPGGSTSPAGTISIDVVPLSANLTFFSVADSYVSDSAPTTNYGTWNQMRIDGSPERRGYVRFDVTGVSGAVTSATLRVYANSTHSTGYEAQQTTDGWVETAINFTNAPAFGPSLGTSGPTSSGTYTEIDVTGYVAGNGEISFALTPLNNTNLRLASRQSSNPPELLLTQDTSGNNPPTADDVATATDEDTGTSWTPSVNDPDPDTLTCSIVSQPANGSATVASDCSTGSYTPDPDHSGTDAFVYRVSDGSLSDDGAVDITINPVNDDPVANAQSVNAEQDATTTISLTGSDVDGDCPLTFTIASPPTNGSLGPVTNAQCSTGTGTTDVDYTPSPGYTGPDSFTFIVTDPSSAVSSPATISITVDAQQTNFTFVTNADSYVSDSAPTTNYGTSNSMRIDGSPDRRGFIEFTVAGVTGTVTSATLRVYAKSSHSLGFQLRAVNDPWTETTITYANAPIPGLVLGASGPTSRNSYVEIDVTAYVTGNGQISFALSPLNNTNLRLSTRESSNPPELVVETS